MKNFTVFVQPRFSVFRCPARIAQEDSGLFGCHPRTCPNCRTVPDGWEGIGENGHKQGYWTDKPEPATLARHSAHYSTPTDYVFRESGNHYLAK